MGKTTDTENRKHCKCCEQEIKFMFCHAQQISEYTLSSIYLCGRLRKKSRQSNNTSIRNSKRKSYYIKLMFIFWESWLSHLRFCRACTLSKSSRVVHSYVHQTEVLNCGQGFDSEILKVVQCSFRLCTLPPLNTWVVTEIWRVHVLIIVYNLSGHMLVAIHNSCLAWSWSGFIQYSESSFGYSDVKGLHILPQQIQPGWWPLDHCCFIIDMCHES